jgi:ATP-dependent DNA helicase RecQ
VAHDVSGISSIQDEEDRLRELLSHAAGNSPGWFGDDLYARVAYVSQDVGSADLDFGVLVRHMLRRWSLRQKRTARVIMAPLLSDRLRRVASTVRLNEESTDIWYAMPWRPDWLDDHGTPDAAAIAGPPAKPRFTQVDLPADPFFQRITGYSSYRTAGQRAAARAVVSVPAGSTMIAMLPTGSGKTEVALCLAERRKNAVCLVVVPTVALARDFERRFRDHYARLNPRVNKSALTIAWTGETPEPSRQLLRAAIREGRQPVVVTSPESVTRALRGALMYAAGDGRLGSIVVDEAHLVTQWGRDFRPEFRTLAHLRNELLDQAARGGHALPITLLLSATLGSAELKDLHRLFGLPGPSTLIAANALRPEPDLWIAASESSQERAVKVMEALANLPRPAILYVTSPESAETWAHCLKEAGYQRLSLVTGKTSSDNRAQVLEALRGSPEAPPETDLVVATSAFGLGIDYAHVRSVVHACLPETVDRWYQEVGRSGRDGHASAAFLLTAPSDVGEAENLTTKVLTPITARGRWENLWEQKKFRQDRIFLDIEGNQESVSEGSYNRRWNAQLVQGLVELKAIERYPVDYEDIVEFVDGTNGRTDWVSVEPRRPDLRDEAFWSTQWAPWQKREWTRSRNALEAMRSLVDGGLSACTLIARAYRPDDEVLRLFGRSARLAEPEDKCGRCPACRRDLVAPPNDPPPRPPELWPLSDDRAVRLDDLVTAAGATDGLVLLSTDDYDATVPALARALVRRGVNHLAGPMAGLVPDGDWLFLDSSPIAPTDLTPFSSFVVYPPGRRIPSTWLSPSVRLANRHAAPAPVDVILTTTDASIGGRRVVRDLRALDAYTALQILGG